MAENSINEKQNELDHEGSINIEFDDGSNIAAQDQNLNQRSKMESEANPQKKKIDFDKIYDERRKNLVEEKAENLTVMLPYLLITIICGSLIATIISDQGKPIISYVIQETDSAGRILTVTDAAKTNKNAFVTLGTVMAILVFATFTLFFLFKFKCYLAINIYLTVSILIGATIIPLMIIYRVAFSLNIRLDIVTVIIICLNLSSCIATSMMFRASRFFDVSSKIILSVTSAINLLIIFPSIVVYVFAIVLSLWDLFAVLYKHGPLIKIIEATADDKKAQKQLGALVMKDKSKNPKAMLGLGDFVFYTLIIVVPVYYDQNYVVSLIICGTVLSGFMATLMFVYVIGRPLPALPISLIIAVGVRFGLYYVTYPASLVFSAKNYF